MNHPPINTFILLGCAALLLFSCRDDLKKQHPSKSSVSSDQADKSQADSKNIAERKPAEKSADLPSKLYDSFLKLPPPKELSTPSDKRGWGAMQQIIHSPKYSAASDIMRSGDKATLERIWREFASMSETDQQVIGMTSSFTQDLGQVSALTSAAQSAKSEDQSAPS